MSQNQNHFRVLIVGVGSIGERHLRCFQKSGRATVGIVETNQQLCVDGASRYDVKHIYPRLETALPHQWDAAVIATPSQMHVSIARTLALAGSHLLIEKPISTNLDGIEELSEIVSRRNLVATIGYTLRSHPALRRMREIIQSQALGEPLQYVCVQGQHFPTYRPAYRDIYYASRNAGGGAIQDALTHMINAGEWLLGPMDRLFADASHQALPGVEVEDTVHVIARHGKVMATYALNQHQAPNETILTAICQHGVVRTELHNGTVKTMTTPGGQWTDESCAVTERDELYVSQANSFLDSIEHGAPVLCSIEEATHTLRAILEILDCVDNAQLREVRVELPSL